MKRLAILLLIAGLTLVPVLSINTTQLSAASEDPSTPIDPSKDNVFNAFFDKMQKIGEAFTESVTSDAFKTTQVLGVGNLNWVYSLLWGTSGVRQSEYLDKLSPADRMGMVGASQGAVISAFQSAPTENIPNMYAGMLLPREIKSNGVYAGPLTSPPDSNSSWGYLQSMGVTKLWGVSFAVSMIFVVVILIIAGIMIMFRTKVGGQAIVTVSLAIQNVILASVMALASFAIGVFFLNLSKYLVLVVAALFDSQIFSGSSALSALGVTYISGPIAVSNKFFAVSFVGDVASFFRGLSWGLLGAWNYAQQDIWTNLQSLAQAVQLAPAVITSPAVFVISRVVIGGALLITSIRIFWTVLSTYVKMILDIVIAPFIFLLGAIPGKQASITDWLLRMFKNAISIPFMFALVNVATYLSISVAFANSNSCQNLMVCITGGFIPAGSSLGTDLILSAVGPHLIVALIILNMVPSVPALVEDMFSGKSTGSIGKSFEGAKKSLQSIPVLGGIFQ